MSTLLNLARQRKVRSEVSPGELAVVPEQNLTLERYRHTEIIATVRLAVPAIVVLMDNWHPN